MEHLDVISVALLGSAKKSYKGEEYYSHPFRHNSKIFTVKAAEDLSGKAALVKFLKAGEKLEVDGKEITIAKDCFTMVAALSAESVTRANEELKAIEGVW